MILALLAADQSGVSKNTLEIVALVLIIICAILYLVGRARH